MNSLKPVITLSIITVIISALLIVANGLLGKDPTILDERMLKNCEELMGEGEFRIVTDWKAEGFKIDKPKEVLNLILKDDGQIAFQIVVDGYETEGLNFLFKMENDGYVTSSKIIAIAETPGLGTKVNDDEFLAKFYGKNEPFVIVKSAPKADNEVDAVTGATYSSKGVAKAFNIALETYKEMI